MRTRRPSLSSAASLFLALAIATTASACLDTTAPGGDPSNPATETYAASLGVNIAQMTAINSSLYFKDLVVGTGAAAAAGKTVRVTYTGWLVNGTSFDSNVGKAAIEFVLGTQRVIEGWDLGLVGMKVGGKRKLVIGSSLGYGADSDGRIPPNSTLVFDVELLGVQ
jgi:FKBP-type peptidyl-prolyl cis-trans isomerase FkpA